MQLVSLAEKVHAPYVDRVRDVACIQNQILDWIKVPSIIVSLCWISFCDRGMFIDPPNLDQLFPTSKCGPSLASTKSCSHTLNSFFPIDSFYC